MSTPVLVKAYTQAKSPNSSLRPANTTRTQALPPVSSYSFAAILQQADCSELQSAVDGIAELCAKNRLSLADEYASHLPPLGEITASTTNTTKPHLLRPSRKRALTSVPEVSSSGSERSRQSSKKKASLFGLKRQRSREAQAPQKMRIGSMGRTIPATCTTAMARSIDAPGVLEHASLRSSSEARLSRPAHPAQRSASEATSSLRRLLNLDGRSAPE